MRVVADYKDCVWFASANGQEELASRVFETVWCNQEETVDRDSVKLFTTLEEFYDAISSIERPDMCYGSTENGTCVLDGETYEYEYDFDGQSDRHHVVVYLVEE